MTDEQLEMIVALLAGQQTALVHLSIIFAEAANLDKVKFAESFRETARILSEDTPNRETVIMVINQIAKGIAEPEHLQGTKGQFH